MRSSTPSAATNCPSPRTQQPDVSSMTASPITTLPDWSLSAIDHSADQLPTSLQSNLAGTTTALSVFSITAQSIDIDGHASNARSSRRRKSRSRVAPASALRHAARTSGARCASSSMNRRTGSRNIPLFQRCSSQASRRSTVTRSGFSTKSATLRSGGATSSSSPIRIYPNPVAGAEGRRPNKTKRPCRAAVTPIDTAARNAA